MITELQKKFWGHDIRIERIFLLDYLSGKVGDHKDLHEELSSLSEKAAIDLFGSGFEAARAVGEPDLTDYLLSLGGVFAKVSCAYPDSKDVVFTIEGKVSCWLPAPERKTSYMWMRDLDTALEGMVLWAENVQNAKLEEVRQEWRKTYDQSH